MINDIRRLTVDDLPRCIALAKDRDWPPEERKWRLLFDVGTVFGVHDDAGDLIGTAVLTRYGRDLAAISMVLVAARHGGQGLGRRLMTHALTEAGDAPAFLYATEYGRPLYQKLGFVEIGTTYTYVGVVTPTAAPGGSRPAQPGDLPAIRALDAQATGVDRGEVLDRLAHFTHRLRVVGGRDGITGYAGAWRNRDQVVIGPVIAETVDDAQTLMADLVAEVDGPVRLDLDDRHPQLRDWATAQGIPLRNPTAVMIRRARRLPGDRRRWFAPLTQALG